MCPAGAHIGNEGEGAYISHSKESNTASKPQFLNMHYTKDVNSISRSLEKKLVVNCMDRKQKRINVDEVFRNVYETTEKH